MPALVGPLGSNAIAVHQPGSALMANVLPTHPLSHWCMHADRNGGGRAPTPYLRVVPMLGATALRAWVSALTPNGRLTCPNRTAHLVDICVRLCGPFQTVCRHTCFSLASGRGTLSHHCAACPSLTLSRAPLFNTGPAQREVAAHMTTLRRTLSLIVSSPNRLEVRPMAPDSTLAGRACCLVASVRAASHVGERYPARA